MFTSEAEMGKRVVAWLEKGGLDVYQEVETLTGNGGRADIVATDGVHVMVVEMKLSLSLDLLMQATAWLPWAHDVWIATPVARNPSSRSFVKKLCAHLGVGVLEVWPHAQCSPGIDGVNAVLQPRFNRRAATAAMRKSLRPEHKTYAKAGSQGGQFTPYKGTCAAVLEYVKQHPGATMKQVIEAVPTHYASQKTARALMTRLIEKDAVPGVGIVRTGQRVQLFAKSAPTPCGAASGPAGRRPGR